MNWNEFLESLAAYFGSLFGSAFGHLAYAAAGMLFVFVIWGFPWLRVIARVGITGKLKTLIFWLLFAPVTIPFLFYNATQTSNPSEVWAGVAASSLYFGWLLLAFAPRKKVSPTAVTVAKA